MSELLPAQVVAAARGWLDTPYHHQGRVRAGLDCVGLLLAPAWDLGIFPRSFNFTRYGRSPTGQLDAMLAAHLVLLPAVQPGAVVAIRWVEAMHHVGIVGDAPGYFTLIHALQAYGEVREHRLGPWHAKRVVSVYGFPGVDYGVAQ